MLVRAGQRVERGELIALVGRTGLADGPHLHYEVHVNGRPVDPLKFVLPSVLAD
jgi:murein DD-endopeptidase